MPVRFRKQFVASEAFESAAVWDVDGDGVLDIISGGFWYQGPTFSKRFKIGDVARCNEYYDDFSTIALDIDGDGQLDFVTGGWWGNSLRWRQRPADPTHEWPEHVLAEATGNVETTRAWDIDGDGDLEIVPNTPGHPFCAYKLIRDAAGKPTGKFARHVISETPIGHGYGFGDIDGDGRGEFVFGRGILKAPAKPLSGPWTHLPEFTLDHWDASCPMLVVDVNGDGQAELIVGHAHNYGLDWYEPRRAADGKRVWVKHPIDPFSSQYHDLQWADLDGDGKPELLTGARFRAHNGNDPGEHDPIGIYIFKWTGEGFVKQIVDYVDPRNSAGGGTGILLALADLRKTGRLDIVAPGKDGLFVYYNEGR